MDYDPNVVRGLRWTTFGFIIFRPHCCYLHKQHDIVPDAAHLPEGHGDRDLCPRVCHNFVVDFAHCFVGY